MRSKINFIKALLKNLRHIAKMLFAYFVIVILVGSCTRDRIDPLSDEPVTIMFGEDINLFENSEGVEIPIVFNKNAFRDGEIMVRIVSGQPAIFRTVPDMENNLIELGVRRGDSRVTFSFMPVDNDIINEMREVNLEIVSVTDGFAVGMKKSVKIIIADDDNTLPLPIINFSDTAGIVLENNSEPMFIRMKLSARTTHSSKVIIELNGPSASRWLTTQPPLTPDNRLEVLVAANAIDANFSVIPVNDNLLEGHKVFNFLISEIEGGIVRGSKLLFSMNLLDDELLGKPKAFETSGGGWRIKDTYVYDELGRIKMISWERETPALQSGTDTYYYGEGGLVTRINKFPNVDEYYHQENGRIFRYEEVKNGVITSYSDYDYDDAGNVGAQSIYYRQPTGELKLGFVFLYLYFINSNNLYVQQTYVPQNGDINDLILISMKTYGDYLEESNPFPISIVPGIRAQQHLPQSYRLEESGETFQYNFSYEFGENGLMKKRITTGASNEVTIYQYY